MIPISQLSKILILIIILAIIIIAAYFYSRQYYQETEKTNRVNNISNNQPAESICLDLCGDGVCAEIVCAGLGCPCPETPQNCPADCQK